MLQAIIYGKRAKNHQKKKQIVDAESLFDQVAGKEFQRWLVAIEIEHREPEQDGRRDPAEAGDGCFTNPYLVEAAVKNAEVQRDRCSDEKIECNPVKGRAHRGAMESNCARRWSSDLTIRCARFCRVQSLQEHPNARAYLRCWPPD